jgi:hypothetical protein
MKELNPYAPPGVTLAETGVRAIEQPVTTLSMFPRAIAGAALICLFWAAWGAAQRTKSGDLDWVGAARLTSVMAPYTFGVSFLAAAIWPVAGRSYRRLRTWGMIVLPLGTAPVYAVGLFSLFVPNWTWYIQDVAFATGVFVLNGSVAAWHQAWWPAHERRVRENEKGA